MASGQVSLNAGAIIGDSIAGNGGPLSIGRSAIVMGADANVTPTGAQLANRILDITSSVSLTATRQVVMPLTTDGLLYIVSNATTGAQSLTFVGASGTGITVASGKRAVIYTDTTNWYRISPDT